MLSGKEIGLCAWSTNVAHYSFGTPPAVFLLLLQAFLCETRSTITNTQGHPVKKQCTPHNSNWPFRDRGTHHTQLQKQKASGRIKALVTITGKNSCSYSHNKPKVHDLLSSNFEKQHARNHGSSECALSGSTAQIIFLEAFPTYKRQFQIPIFEIRIIFANLRDLKERKI